MPASLDNRGIIVDCIGRPRVGICMMPGNTSRGAIEHCVSRLIPEKDELWPKAREICHFVLVNYGTFGQRDLPKAELHTWLAWQEEPATPPGLAITKKYFDANSRPAGDFVSWARMLCSV